MYGRRFASRFLSAAAAVRFVVVFAVKSRFVKRGIIHIIILFVAALVLADAQCFAESLVMHDLSCAEEFNNVVYVRIVGKAKNVVVGYASFLLCCELIRRTRCEKTLKTPGFSLAHVFCRYAFVKKTFKNSSEFQWERRWFL